MKCLKRGNEIADSVNPDQDALLEARSSLICVFNCLSDRVFWINMVIIFVYWKLFYWNAASD